MGNLDFVMIEIQNSRADKKHQIGDCQEGETDTYERIRFTNQRFYVIEKVSNF